MFSALSFQPDDVVTSLLPGNLPHLMIVTDKMADGVPLVVHNIGSGARIENALFEYELTGHYRFTSEAIERMRALQ